MTNIETMLLPDQTPISKPDHVPAHLVWDNSLELFSREMDDPYVAISQLHEGPGIVWSTYGYRGEPAWIVTKFEYLQEVYHDRRFLFGARSEVEDLLQVSWSMVPFESDPPLHGLYRKLLNPWFSPVAVNRLDTAIREICNELFAKFERRGSCEFMSELASVLPAKVFMSFMGLDSAMLPQFLHWANEWMRGATFEDRVKAARDILAYLERVAADRKHHPRDDLATAIVTAELDGRPVKHEEVLGMFYILYLGGLDTVVSSLGWHVRYLANDEALQTRLREQPEDIPKAVDEFLRAYGVTTTRKVVREDLEFHGVRTKAGDLVVTSAPLASRDPTQFNQPHVINIDRGSGHLSFGNGIHTCLGMHLARRELRIVLEEITTRLPNLRIDGLVQYHTTGVWGLDALPLAWG